MSDFFNEMSGSGLEGDDASFGSSLSGLSSVEDSSLVADFLSLSDGGSLLGGVDSGDLYDFAGGSSDSGDSVSKDDVLARDDLSAFDEVEPFFVDDESESESFDLSGLFDDGGFDDGEDF